MFCLQHLCKTEQLGLVLIPMRKYQGDMPIENFLILMKNFRNQ